MWLGCEELGKGLFVQSWSLCFGEIFIATSSGSTRFNSSMNALLFLPGYQYLVASRVQAHLGKAVGVRSGRLTDGQLSFARVTVGQDAPMLRALESTCSFMR